MLDPKLYEGREQTFIKHFVLRKYLQKLAYKFGWYGGTLNYVDCFAGPWMSKSESLADSSPFIAIEELREARTKLGAHGRKLKIRCCFVEKDPGSYTTLQRKLAEVTDIETLALNGEFENLVPEILRFVRGSMDRSFSFFFIDPTGWNGYALDVIRPILTHQPGEVLINFMTEFVRRFIFSDKPGDQKSFLRLFGSLGEREGWQKLEGLDREEAMLAAYCERLKEAGEFDLVANSVVLKPMADRSHFHLVYATRNIEGLRVFRNDAERPATKEQKEARFRARTRAEEQSTGQMALFARPPGRGHSDVLEERYLERAKARVHHLLEERRSMLFDELEEEFLLFPMTNTQALKDWLVSLAGAGRVRFEGLGPRGRVPQPKKDHRIIYLDDG